MKKFNCVALFYFLGCFASLLNQSNAAPHVDNVSYKEQFKSLNAEQQTQLIEMEDEVSRFSSLFNEKDNMFVTMSNKETVLQSSTDTLNNLTAYGSVNDNVDIISLISISKINSLFAERAAKGDKTLMTEFNANLTGNMWWADDPRTFYYFSLKLGSPKFFFDPTRKELGMGFKFQNGSTILKHLGWNGNETTLDVSGSAMTAKITLDKVKGQADAVSVALNISQTEFAVSFGPSVDPGVVPYFQVAIQKFFIENYHDKNYVLGTVIVNQNSTIIPSLNPKMFKMTIVPDAQRPGNGDGFLALFIQTTTTNLPDYQLKLPSEFNLVPDGFDTALYITNQNFYQNVLKESFTGVKALKVTADSRGIYSVTDGSLPTFNKAYYINGCHLTDWIFTCSWTNHFDAAVTPAGMKQKSTGNTKELAFNMGSSTEVNYCDAWCSTSSQSATQTYSSTYTFGISSSSDEVIITGKTDATNNLPSSSGWTNFWTNTGYISTNFDSYSGEISRYMSDAMPKISNLNIFRASRLLFPDRQIHQFKDVNLVADLVMWGNTVERK
eukprot:Nk52_evm14s257 gene=Nk52_evmTU14s257